jgi:hypothetical protein
MPFSFDDMDRVDWDLLQNGAVNLYRRVELYEDDLAALKALGYAVADIDFQSMPSFHEDVSKALDWQKLFGYPDWQGSLDALNDGFGSLELGDGEGFGFGVRNFHRLWSQDRRLATTLADIIEDTSRSHLLMGGRLIGLFQTNNADLDLGTLGGRQAQWNRREWLRTNR